MVEEGKGSAVEEGAEGGGTKGERVGRWPEVEGREVDCWAGSALVERRNSIKTFPRRSIAETTSLE